MDIDVQICIDAAEEFMRLIRTREGDNKKNGEVIAYFFHLCRDHGPGHVLGMLFLLPEKITRFLQVFKGIVQWKDSDITRFRNSYPELSVFSVKDIRSMSE